MKYASLDLGTVEAVFNKLGGVEGATQFLRGEWVLVEKPRPEPIPAPLDFIVHVDRSVKPTYPNWVVKLIHPELELAGPAEYDLSKVDQWLHDDQKRGSIVGNTIYKYLKKDNTLADCLGLEDLLAIQQKGIKVFRQLFADKAVFGWRSVVRHSNGYLDVPCLRELELGDGVEVMLDWYWLGLRWNSNDPALHFSK